MDHKIHGEAQDVSHIEDNEKHIYDEKKDVDVVVKKTQDSRFGLYLATHKPSAFSKSVLMLYPILFVAFMNSAANGFDGNTFGGVSDLPDFENRFGTNVAASDGFLAAIYILGMSNSPNPEGPPINNL